MSQRDNDLIYEAYIAENSTPELDIEKIKTYFSREDANNPGYWNEIVMPAIEDYMHSDGGGLHFPDGNPHDAHGLERYLNRLKNPLTHGVRRFGSAVRTGASKLGDKIKRLPRPSLHSPIKFNKR